MSYRISRCIAAIALVLLAACQPLPAELAPGAPPPPDRAAPTATIQAQPSTPTAVAASSPTPSPVPSPTVAWAVRAGLLADAWDDETWDRLEAQARTEGAGLLYADTSRAASALGAFMAQHGGLRVQTQALSSHDIHDRLLAEQQAAKPAADVYMAGDAPRTLALLEQGYLWNYAPADLTSAVPPALSAPLLVHHWSALLLIYNPARAAAPPIDSWWDLTRPEWRGRVALPDPLVDGRALYLLATIAQHGDDMAQSYRAEFGQAIVLSDDCPNAGYQWIKSLLANEPRLARGDAEVAAIVGSPTDETLWIGLCGYEQFAKVGWGELSFAPLPAVSPAAGLQWPTYLAVVNEAPHPAMAKVMVRWLVGATQGYAPWAVAGYYPARSDLPDPPGAVPRAELEPRLWKLDCAYLADNLLTVRDHVAAYLGRQVGGR